MRWMKTTLIFGRRLGARTGISVNRHGMGAVFYLRRSKKTEREKEIAGMSDSKMYRFAAGTNKGKIYRFCQRYE